MKKNMTCITPHYSMGEEIFSAVSHGIGAGLALVGYGYMLALTVHYGTLRATAAVSIYCLTLFAMFICSTCYHALPYPTAKHVLRILDHCAIYLLIAGTYTPFTMLILSPVFGWTIFAIIWLAAIVGIVLNAVDLARYARVSVACYVAMGWAIVFCLKPLLASLPVGGVALLALGGLFYTGGVFFYVNKRRRYFHPVWHLFVLAGAIAHFYAVLLYVLPTAFL